MAVARRFLMPGAVGSCGFAAGPYNASDGSSPNCRMGASPASANPPFWYSFDYGSVHVAVISTEHDLTDGSDQREVLAAGTALHQNFCSRDD